MRPTYDLVRIELEWIVCDRSLCEWQRWNGSEEFVILES